MLAFVGQEALVAVLQEAAHLVCGADQALDRGGVGEGWRGFGVFLAGNPSVPLLTDHHLARSGWYLVSPQLLQSYLQIFKDRVFCSR